MHVLALFVQLTLWVATTHAFYIWSCSEDKICPSIGPDRKREIGDGQPQPVEGGVTYALLQRVPNNDEDPATKAARAASRLAKKYGSLQASRIPQKQGPNLVKRTNTYSVVQPAAPTTANSAGIYQDGTDFSYFIQAGFGSSQKPLYMLLDSGAGTTWVMGSTCQSAACTMHNTFGPADSKTLQPSTKSFSIAYGSGSVSGQLAQDDISVAGMKVGMSFGIASVTSDDFTHFPFDGILGLSMSTGATDNFMQVLKADKTLKANVFGITLNRNSDGGNPGEVTFGAVDPSKYTGDISYTTVSSTAGGDWAVPMDDMGYDSKAAGITGRLAYIDTGTSYVFGPASDVAAIHKLIPGAASTDGVTYSVPCDSKDITISFSGVKYTVSSEDWLSGSGSSCRSNIYGHEVVQGAWLLGDLFLKNVYSVFDADQTRIGFAAKAAVSGSATVSGSASGSTAASNAKQSTMATATITSSPASQSQGSSVPGLSGHETAATAGGTAVAETASAGSTPTASASPGDQLESNSYVSIMCIVAVIAMVA
ncbi:aspartic peptidase domain-containing protein [Diplogelasinospora grovesii]|uniref:Aspartic peptidase domain-containing protein n=1 Tax=Diplogelasinospora grovesii TaxID=303347 RepID=A0AAN6NIC0_9PEZI|nr:aspartic peptidase domain-containing protein [Diplogelasinospora grovesii]